MWGGGVTCASFTVNTLRIKRFCKIARPQISQNWADECFVAQRHEWSILLFHWRPNLLFSIYRSYPAKIVPRIISHTKNQRKTRFLFSEICWWVVANYFLPTNVFHFQLCCRTYNIAYNILKVLAIFRALIMSFSLDFVFLVWLLYLFLFLFNTYLNQYFLLKMFILSSLKLNS